jgi:hypothetical protein
MEAIVSWDGRQRMKRAAPAVEGPMLDHASVRGSLRRGGRFAASPE